VRHFYGKVLEKQVKVNPSRPRSLAARRQSVRAAASSEWTKLGAMPRSCEAAFVLVHSENMLAAFRQACSTVVIGQLLAERHDLESSHIEAYL
jgi:hypothetical protein